MSQSFKTFVITLPEATARQNHMSEMLAKHSIEFDFFDAVDGRGFDVPNHPHYNALKRRLFFGRDMTGGEIGVLLSHRAIYQTMVDQNIDLALVFEDDAVIIRDDFKDVVDALKQQTDRYELVRFLGSDKVAGLKQHKAHKIIGDYTLNRLRTVPGGAHAYMITLAGAQKMLKLLDRVYLPIDTLQGHCWLNGLNAFNVQPGIAVQDEEQDQYIGEQRFDKALQIKGWVKFVYPISRALFKLYEGVMKSAYYKFNTSRDKA